MLIVVCFAWAKTGSGGGVKHIVISIFFASVTGFALAQANIFFAVDFAQAATCSGIRDNGCFRVCTTTKRTREKSNCLRKCRNLHTECMKTGIWGAGGPKPKTDVDRK